jgi:hypothetical protein
LTPGRTTAASISLVEIVDELVCLTRFIGWSMVTISKNQPFNFESNTRFDLNELSDK